MVLAMAIQRHNPNPTPTPYAHIDRVTYVCGWRTSAEVRLSVPLSLSLSPPLLKRMQLSERVERLCDCFVTAPWVQRSWWRGACRAGDRSPLSCLDFVPVYVSLEQGTAGQGLV